MAKGKTSSALTEVDINVSQASSDALDRAEKRKKKHYARQKEKRRLQRASDEKSKDETGGGQTFLLL